MLLPGRLCPPDPLLGGFVPGPQWRNIRPPESRPLTSRSLTWSAEYAPGYTDTKPVTWPCTPLFNRLSLLCFIMGASRVVLRATPALSRHSREPEAATRELTEPYCLYMLIWALIWLAERCLESTRVRFYFENPARLLLPRGWLYNCAARVIS